MSTHGPGEAEARRPAWDRVGRVLQVTLGVVLVRMPDGPVRATLGGDLLADIARDRDGAPRVGDRVVVRTWGDGAVTVERVLARPVPGPPRAG